MSFSWLLLIAYCCPPGQNALSSRHPGRQDSMSEQPWGKSIAIWYAPELYDGDVDRLVGEAVRLGLSKLCPKFGNGTSAWQGLGGLGGAGPRAGPGGWGWGG